MDSFKDLPTTCRSLHVDNFFAHGTIINMNNNGLGTDTPHIKNRFITGINVETTEN